LHNFLFKPIEARLVRNFTIPYKYKKRPL
jgi:hypothetical protein